MDICCGVDGSAAWPELVTNTSALTPLPAGIDVEGKNVDYVSLGSHIELQLVSCALAAISCRRKGRIQEAICVAAGNLLDEAGQVGEAVLCLCLSDDVYLKGVHAIFLILV